MPAKTIQGAEKHLKEITEISASFEGIEDVKIANMINKEMINLHQKTNGLKVSIPGGEKIKVINKISIKKLDSFTLGEFDHTSKTVILNKKIFRNTKAYKKHAAEFKKGLVNVNPGAVIDHEVAHGISRVDSELNNIKNKIYKKYGKDSISNYSLHSANEMVSEAFVYYLDFGKLPGILSKLEPIFKRILTKGVFL